MMTVRELSTIRASLRFWEDEMVPHGEQIMLPYFNGDTERPLGAKEHRELIERLQRTALRYAVYDSVTDHLTSTALLASPAFAVTSDAQSVTTILLS